MSQLEVNREETREGLCKIDEFDVGDVCIDTECGDTLLIVRSDGVLSDAVDQYLEENDTEGNMPCFSGLDDTILAVCLESGDLATYKKPYRKVIKRTKAARLYVKE